MEERYTLLSGRGSLHIREENGRAVCRVELPDDRRGLYKAYLTGAGGRLLLGTLTPENGTLCLCRTLSIDDLSRKRLWPPTGGAAELAYAPPPAGEGRRQPPPGWSRESCPGRLLGDDLLSCAAAQLKGVLLRRTQTGFELALPYDCGRPFGLTPLFCFARPARLAGEDYMIFSFNGRGCPVFPYKERGVGKDSGVNQAKE